MYRPIDPFKKQRQLSEQTHQYKFNASDNIVYQNYGQIYRKATQMIRDKQQLKRQLMTCPYSQIEKEKRVQSSSTKILDHFLTKKVDQPYQWQNIQTANIAMQSGQKSTEFIKNFMIQNPVKSIFRGQQNTKASTIYPSPIRNRQSRLKIDKLVVNQSMSPCCDSIIDVSHNLSKLNGFQMVQDRSKSPKIHNFQLRQQISYSNKKDLKAFYKQQNLKSIKKEDIVQKQVINQNSKKGIAKKQTIQCNQNRQQKLNLQNGKNPFKQFEEQQLQNQSFEKKVAEEKKKLQILRNHSKENKNSKLVEINISIPVEQQPIQQEKQDKQKTQNQKTNVLPNVQRKIAQPYNNQQSNKKLVQECKYISNLQFMDTQLKLYSEIQTLQSSINQKDNKKKEQKRKKLTKIEKPLQKLINAKKPITQEQINKISTEVASVFKKKNNYPSSHQIKDNHISQQAQSFEQKQTNKEYEKPQKINEKQKQQIQDWDFPQVIENQIRKVQSEQNVEEGSSGVSTVNKNSKLQQLILQSALKKSSSYSKKQSKLSLQQAKRQSAKSYFSLKNIPQKKSSVKSLSVDLNKLSSEKNISKKQSKKSIQRSNEQIRKDQKQINNNQLELLSFSKYPSYSEQSAGAISFSKLQDYKGHAFDQSQKSASINKSNDKNEAHQEEDLFPQYESSSSSANISKNKKYLQAVIEEQEPSQEELRNSHKQLFSKTKHEQDEKKKLQKLFMDDDLSSINLQSQHKLSHQSNSIENSQEPKPKSATQSNVALQKFAVKDLKRDIDALKNKITSQNNIEQKYENSFQNKVPDYVQSDQQVEKSKKKTSKQQKSQLKNASNESFLNLFEELNQGHKYDNFKQDIQRLKQKMLSESLSS